MTRSAVLKTFSLLAAGCVLFASTRAVASTIQFQGEGKAGIVEIRSNGFPGGVWTYAGELDWSWVGLPADGFTSSWIYTYCVGADNYLQNQQGVTARPSDALTTAGVTDAGAKVAWLIDTYAPGIHASGTGTDAAALQVAIWEALYDNDRNLSTGRFQLLDARDALVWIEAQSYLTALGFANYSAVSATWLDTSAGQDQLVPTPIAEPASLLMLATGCLAACGWRLARRSRWLEGAQSGSRQTSVSETRCA